MDVAEYEFKIIKRVRKDMLGANDRDGVNQVYRQARIWNRIHHFYGSGSTYQRYVFLNNKFKQARWEALSSFK